MTINLIWPVDMGKSVVTDTYQDHLNRPNYKGNPGVDIASYGGVNVPVWASADGEIVKAGWDDTGYGNVIKIRHEGGNETVYAHLARFEKKSGRVKEGDVIGYMGMTGNTTGVHVHWELRINGKCVDAAKCVWSHIYPVQPPVEVVEVVVKDGDVVRVTAPYGLNMRDEPLVEPGTYVGALPFGARLQVAGVVEVDGNKWARVEMYMAIEYEGVRYLEKTGE